MPTITLLWARLCARWGRHFMALGALRLQAFPFFRGDLFCTEAANDEPPRGTAA